MFYNVEAESLGIASPNEPHTGFNASLSLEFPG